MQAKHTTIVLWAAVLGLSLGMSIAEATTVYRWVDAQGTVHFGERPPKGVEAVEVSVAEAAKNATTDNPFQQPATDPAPPNAAQLKREERAKAREEQERERARLAAACEAQKSRLEQLIPRPKVVLQNPDGTSRMLGDDERLGMIDEAQAFVDEYCDQ